MFCCDEVEWNRTMSHSINYSPLWSDKMNSYSDFLHLIIYVCSKRNCVHSIAISIVVVWSRLVSTVIHIWVEVIEINEIIMANEFSLFPSDDPTWMTVDFVRPDYSSPVPLTHSWVNCFQQQNHFYSKNENGIFVHSHFTS